MGYRETLAESEKIREKLLQFLVAAFEEWGEARVAGAVQTEAGLINRPNVEMHLRVYLDGE